MILFQIYRGVLILFIESRLKLYRAFLIPVLILFAFLPSTALAQDSGFIHKFRDFHPEWGFSGQNTLRMDQYEKSGDKSAAPYQFENFQLYNDFSFGLNRRLSRAAKFEAQISGTVTESDYRSDAKGFILERGKIKWQKSDGFVPFRVEIGDFFGQQTFRTIQKSLKGVQLEIQPRTNSERRKHSIQIFGGVAKPTYRKLGNDIDFYSGGSWLIEDSLLGGIALTAVFNYKEETYSPRVPSREQLVTSLAWGKDFNLWEQKIELEGEVAGFFGDHSTGARSTSNEEDIGLFAQLKGKSKNLPLTYRLRSELYGEDYRPAGAAINPDQLTTEAHVAWRFRTGLQARGRVQNFRTGLESGNYTDRFVQGINISGPVYKFNEKSVVTSFLNAFNQNVKDEDRTTDMDTQSFNASLAVPVVEHLFARPGVFLTFTKDQNTHVTTTKRQFSLNVDYDYKLFDFKGAVSPGLTMRHNTGDGRDRGDVYPAISMSLRNRKHSLHATYNTLIQDARFVNGIDIITSRSSFKYVFNHGINRLGFDVDFFNRDPSPGNSTEAYRVGAFWEVSLGRPARVPKQRQAKIFAPPLQQQVAQTRGLPKMEELAPGADLKSVQAMLESTGILQPSGREGLLIYEAQLYNTIEQRQRLGLLYSNNSLEKSVLVIDFTDVGEVDTLFQTFEKVRKVLIDRYGPADYRVEEGEFGPNLLADLYSGKFRRIIEWSTKAGRLRFGIPSRTDGQVRMEIIHAHRFPSQTESNWGIETLR